MRGRHGPANLIKVYTWFAHCVQESDKVSSKFTCQYANDGKSLHCCQKKITSEVTKQQKKVYFDVRNFYIHAKQIYISDKKVYNIDQKYAEKFI
jgi:hypothetical protein